MKLQRIDGRNYTFRPTGPRFLYMTARPITWNITQVTDKGWLADNGDTLLLRLA